MVLTHECFLDVSYTILPYTYCYHRLLQVDLLLFSGGRDANSDGLDLDVVAVEVGKYGRIVVDQSTFHTTSSQSIYAIGDVIGLK